ncbi:MAG: hypothetical protein J6D57_01490 [Mogibacterium sp.]|nr:hypothetical protein [Mogibacterium sp.]
MIPGLFPLPAFLSPAVRTQAGSTFLPHALNLLKAEEEAVHSVRPAGRLTGELRICSASSYAQEVLPGILLKFLTQHPGVNVTVKISDFLEDAVSSQFIVADRDISYCAVLEKQLRRRGVEFRPAMEIGSVGAIVNMLLRGFGVSFLPEFAVSKYLQTGELARLDTEDIDIELYSYLIYSRDRWLNPVMKEFIRIAGESQKER